MSRARLLVATACAATMLAAQLAAAGTDSGTGVDTADGGCMVVAVDVDSLTNFVTQGLLLDASATRDAGGNPVGASVTCWMQVNGFEVPDTRFTTNDDVVQAGLAEVAFALRDTDSVLVCERFAYDDGTAAQTCDPAPTEQAVPPPQVPDALRAVVESSVDPIACPLLVAHAGAYPGGLVIAADGDTSYTDPLALVSLDVHDCPPYRQTAPPALAVIGPVRT